LHRASKEFNERREKEEEQKEGDEEEKKEGFFLRKRLCFSTTQTSEVNERRR